MSLITGQKLKVSLTAGQKLKLSLTAGQKLKDRFSVMNIIKINV